MARRTSLEQLRISALDKLARVEFRRAEKLENSGDLVAAMAAFEKVLQLHPTEPSTVLRLARIATKLDMFDQAESLYRVLLTLVPGDPGAVSNLASLLRGMDRHDEAIELYKAAVQANPEN